MQNGQYIEIECDRIRISISRNKNVEKIRIELNFVEQHKNRNSFIIQIVFHVNTENQKVEPLIFYIYRTYKKQIAHKIEKKR